MNPMRTLSGRYRLRERQISWTRQVAPCTGVNHDVPVNAYRPHTKEFAQQARVLLGLAAIRAREAAGLTQRALAERARISRTSLYKLETGESVGPQVYEGVGRALPNWTEDTPRLILEGADPPALGAPPAPPSPAPDPRVSAVITSTPDEPAFWVALADEVPKETFDKLWQLYLETRGSRRLAAERDRPNGPAKQERSRPDTHSE